MYLLRGKYHVRSDSPREAVLMELCIPSPASSEAENIFPVGIDTERTYMQHIDMYT